MAFHSTASVIDRTVVHIMNARANNFQYFMTLTQQKMNSYSHGASGAPAINGEHQYPSDTFVYRR